MERARTQIVVTLGPASDTEAHLLAMKDKGTDFVRVNMSHSSLEYLSRCMALAHKVGIPFILDTEGSQVRTGDLSQDIIYFAENDAVRLCAEEVVGNAHRIALKPAHVVKQLAPGDLIHIDFDTLILRVTDVSSATDGHVIAKAVAGGSIGKNKAVVIDPVFDRHFRLPPLSPKDYESIELGLEAGVEHIAVSFVRSAASIREARRATNHAMRIISKVECVDALENLDEIIEETDSILIDRGDLSKEIPLEKIPFTQKIIMQKAREHRTEVFVATNLLETMIERKKPTRAEVQDVVNSIIDGAAGLTLAAETAIGKHPLECINMLNRLIQHTEDVMAGHPTYRVENALITSLQHSPYLRENVSTSLVGPHGGHLVNRVATAAQHEDQVVDLPTIMLDANTQMEVEQIAIGAYSPLDGFMGEQDFHSVLTEMRLSDGTIWPLPITLPVAQTTAAELSIGQSVGLTNNRGDIVALLELDEKYSFDRQYAAKHLFGTDSADHPGVRMLPTADETLLAGQITLLKARDSDTRAYELTPRQLRKLFDERGWAKVLGFHTRNVIHRGHEFIQLEGMRRAHCDGLLVQPVVGSKKPGDFMPAYVIMSYEKMMEQFYPRDRVVCAAFATFSRYAGPREALFTAICRKNFGCSHFVVGRDHTGIADYYGPHAAHEMFDRFPDLGIEIVKFNEVVYSEEHADYVERDASAADDVYGTTHRFLSGSEARAMFQRGEAPPDWFMRPEIAKMILAAVNEASRFSSHPFRSVLSRSTQLRLRIERRA